MEHWEIIANGQIVVDKTAEELWENMCSYFKHCDENPIEVKRTITSGKGVGGKAHVELKRPYTIKGMCLHCGISERYLVDCLESRSKDDMYYIVVERAKYIIHTQNLEYALVGEFSPILTSKVLNMDSPDSNPSPIKIEHINGSPQLSTSEYEVSKTIDEEYEKFKRSSVGKKQE